MKILEGLHKKPQEGNGCLPAQLTTIPILRPFVIVDTHIIKLYSDDGYYQLS